MEFRRPVLVVVDVQNGFANEHSSFVIPKVASLIDDCRKRELPIILTKFINTVGSPFERLMGWTNVRQAPETDLCEAINPADDIVIEKHFYTAFTDEFLRLADSSRWETILICGVSTESCVLKTAVDAFEKGFRPLVITDACASDLGADVHKKGLDILEVLIGKRQLTTTEDFLAAIQVEQ